MNISVLSQTDNKPTQLDLLQLSVKAKFNKKKQSWIAGMTQQTLNEQENKQKG